VQDFRDAAALQFPLTQGQPYFCMGQQGGNVNIWHWKADWQADILALQEMEWSATPDMYVDGYPFAPAEEGQIASAQ
jgi:DMSO reductase family type II enzyme heme b subunit